MEVPSWIKTDLQCLRSNELTLKSCSYESLQGHSQFINKCVVKTQGVEGRCCSTVK